MTPLSLVIFDDSHDFREGLLPLFRFTEDVAVVGAYADCTTLEPIIRELKPAVVLMDNDMPGMDGIEATGIVKTIALEYWKH